MAQPPGFLGTPRIPARCKEAATSPWLVPRSARRWPICFLSCFRLFIVPPIEHLYSMTAGRRGPVSLPLSNPYPLNPILTRAGSSVHNVDFVTVVHRSHGHGASPASPCGDLGDDGRA